MMSIIKSIAASTHAPDGGSSFHGKVATDARTGRDSSIGNNFPPLLIVRCNILHLSDVSIEFDVQLGELVVAATQNLEMFRLAAGISDRLIPCVSCRLQRSLGGCVIVVVVGLFVINGDCRFADGQSCDLHLGRLHFTFDFDGISKLQGGLFETFRCYVGEHRSLIGFDDETMGEDVSDFTLDGLELVIRHDEFPYWSAFGLGGGAMVSINAAALEGAAEHHRLQAAEVGDRDPRADHPSSLSDPSVPWDL